MHELAALQAKIAAEFQSAPGLEAGRCEHAPVLGMDRRMFQSAPGLEAGRCLAISAADSEAALFQSAPGLEAGRCQNCRH